jgi:hypothetical protein
MGAGVDVTVESTVGEDVCAGVGVRTIGAIIVAVVVDSNPPSLVEADKVATDMTVFMLFNPGSTQADKQSTPIMTINRLFFPRCTISVSRNSLVAMQSGLRISAADRMVFDYRRHSKSAA